MRPFSLLLKLTTGPIFCSEVISWAWVATLSPIRKSGSKISLFIRNKPHRPWLRAERKLRRTQQSGIVAAFAADNLHLRSRQRKRPFGNLMIHVFLKKTPAVYHSAANYNHLWIQNVDEISKTNPQIDAHAAKNFKREFVAFQAGTVNFFGGCSSGTTMLFASIWGSHAASG